VTRVLAETTKVQNNFINGKKKFKRILSCLFGGRQKVQVTICLRGLNLYVSSAANSVGTTLEFTAFGSSPYAKPSRASAFHFSVDNHCFYGGPNTFSQEKTPMFI